MSVATLWWVMLAGAAVIFILMMLLLALVLFVPARISKVPSRYWQVGGGILFPLPILIALTFFSFIQGEAQIADKGKAQTIRISAQAMMWAWDFTYHLPDGDITSRNVLHIPVDQPVEVLTTSRDVIHGFWVPRLSGKVDAIPGQQTSIILMADRAGKFGGICAEYCGSEHSSMRFDVEAHTQSDFATKMLELENANGQ